MEKREEAKKGLWSSVPFARLGTATGIGATSIVGAPVTLVPPPGKPAADDTRFTTYKLTLTCTKFSALRLDRCLSPDLRLTDGLGGDNMTAVSLQRSGVVRTSFQRPDRLSVCRAALQGFGPLPSDDGHGTIRFGRIRCMIPAAALDSLIAYPRMHTSSASRGTT